MDTRLFHAINGLAGRSSSLDHLLRWGAQDLPILLGLLLACAWFWPAPLLDRQERQRLVVYSVSAALLGLAAAQIIGHLWLRDRPYLVHPAHLIIPPSADASFPSDHAVGGFGLATPFLIARRRLGWVLVAIAGLLAFCRVAAGTHYPSDVVAGAVVGATAAVVIWNARDWIEIPLAPAMMLARRLRLA
jgi:undecaprenyl-diphosphatase